MAFLDAKAGYHQIPLHLPNQEKTAFITPRGVFCYKVMSFGCKNAGAIYQRLMNRMFKRQLVNTMEVYIDDMLVKSRRSEDHLTDLGDTFSTLREYRLKMNAAKYVFEVGFEKFLGYLVSRRGVKANSEQIQAILDVWSPRTVREVQKLTRMLATLNCFISHSSEKCKPFFGAIGRQGRIRGAENVKMP